MNLKTKRRCTYATIVFYNLCNGIAYGIVFPTLWNYVHERYGGSQSMFGFIIAAYSISSFIANPIIGFWGDKLQNTKLILSVAIVAEIMGSFMYFAGISSWFLASSRLVSGLGSGGMAVVIADISRTTTEEDRTPVLSLVILSRQIGLLVGPGLNIFLANLDFKLASLTIDEMTSPGLIMAALWILCEFAVLFMYNNLTALKDEEDVEHLFIGYRRESSIPQEPYQSDLEVSGEGLLTSSFPNYSSFLTATSNLPSSQSSSLPDLQVSAVEHFEKNAVVAKDDIKTTSCRNPCIPSENFKTFGTVPELKVRHPSECSSATDNMIESAERFIQSASKSFGDESNVELDQQYPGFSDVRRYSEVTPYESVPTSNEENQSLTGSFNASFLRDEIVALLGLNFFCSFAQTSFETVVTPLGQKYYGFKEFDNSLLYMCAGVEIILVFLGVRYVSRKVSDRGIILFGIISLCIALALPLFFFINAIPGENSTLPYFIITVILDLLGISAIVICLSSLLSKLVSQDCQALAQGLRRSMMSLGCIMGPLWGGAYLNWLYALFAVPLAVLCLIGVLFLCSFKKLV